MKRCAWLCAALLCIALSLSGCIRDGEESSPFEYTITDEGAELTRYTGSAKEVEIPDSFEGRPVTSIGARAFYNCTGLETVSLPDSVAGIGQEAFALCTSLTAFQVDENNVAYTAQDGVLFSKDMTTLVACPEGREGTYTVPDGVETLGEQAFSRCVGLTGITLPESLTTIKAAAFYNCSALTGLTIPDGVTSIGPTAFCRCSVLAQITLPESLSTLETGLFSDCPALTALVIPAGVTDIQEAVFWNCTALAAFETSGESAAFDAVDGVLFSKDHTRLIRYPAGKKDESYTLPDSVNEIAEEAFSYNASLKSIRLPGRLNEVAASAFYNCPALEEVVLEEGITAVGDKAFAACTSLKSLSLPSTLATIGASAFNNCDSLETAALPAGLTTIGEGAFSYCDSLKKITVPAGVTSIGTTAFGGCESLRLYGQEGSEAEEYALREEIPFNDNDKTTTSAATAAAG